MLLLLYETKIFSLLKMEIVPLHIFSKEYYYLFRIHWMNHFWKGTVRRIIEGFLIFWDSNIKIILENLLSNVCNISIAYKFQLAIFIMSVWCLSLRGPPSEFFESFGYVFPFVGRSMINVSYVIFYYLFGMNYEVCLWRQIIIKFFEYFSLCEKLNLSKFLQCFFLLK